MNNPGALLIVLGAIAAFPHASSAQGYPSRPVRMVVAQAAGGPTDVVTRIFAVRLTELLGQQVVVDNRPGAGGSVAGDIVAHAPADGYTLCAAANGTVAIAPHFLKLSYSVTRDLTPVALLGNSPLALMVYPGLPANSVKELIALAKARPGTINFASSGQGGTGHLAGELFKMMAGVNITHVPYKGAGPALVGVVAGEIQMLISGLSSGLPYIKQRQVRALAVTSPKRLAVLPDTPAVAETVPGYEAGSWYAILTRAGTPRPIIDLLNQESVKAINAPDIQSKLISAGVDPETLTPEQLGVKIRTDTERWGRVVKAAGVKQQ
ncbi:MAG: LacI family transcriptional regulator [Betaproteobacteria bacterium]|jgi:tripartite-type tricarboxylate transporter receptor subunit TctC|nr:LacI family transcriptional regulator [Betaproteobacteria bacterium]